MRIINPIIPGTHPDPSVCRVGGDYYLVTSSFEYFPGLPIFHSRNLVDWRQIGHVLDRPSQLDFTNRLYPSALFAAVDHGTPACAGIWAPTLRYHAGLFYLVTSHVDGIGNFFVTAEDPAGPWSEPLLIDGEGIDPSFFFDDDGRVYYTRRGQGGIVQAEIDLQTGHLRGRPQVVVEKFVSPDIEGPHLYKIDGTYYLMAAEGGTRFGHAEVIGRASSPWGPFEPCPHNPILTQRDQGHPPIRDTGHADLVDDGQGNWWLFCLGTRHRHYSGASILGRETFIAPVTWVDGWPIVGLDGHMPASFESPLLPAQNPQPAAWLDDFDGSSLDLAWNFIRNPNPRAWSLSERPGHLRLNGLPASLNDLSSPAFVGRRQDQFDLTAACQIAFYPGGENEEAGLTVFINNRHHYDLVMTLRGGLRSVVLRRFVGDLFQESPPILAGEDPLHLEATCDGTRYAFFVRLATGERLPVGSGLARLLSPETAGDDWVWTGVYLGLFATGAGQPCRGPADFDWFEVRY